MPACFLIVVATDAQGQLLSETRGGVTYSYVYDGAGNLLSKTKSSGSGTDSYTPHPQAGKVRKDLVDIYRKCRYNISVQSRFVALTAP